MVIELWRFCIISAMSWLNLAGNKEHGPIAIEAPEGETWGRAFGELAVSLLPRILADCHEGLRRVKHIITFPPTPHSPARTDADINDKSCVYCRGAIAGFRFEQGKLIGSVVTIIDRQSANRLADHLNEMPAEIVALYHLAHEIREIDFHLRQPNGLHTAFIEAGRSLDPGYKTKPWEVAADKGAFKDLFENLGSELHRGLAALYLTNQELPITEILKDQLGTEKQFATAIKKSVAVGEIKHGDRVNLSRGGLILDACSERFEKLAIPLQLEANWPKNGAALCRLPRDNRMVSVPLSQVKKIT